jgi:hypothetical protein
VAVGNLASEFNFTQTPRPPLLLSTFIPAHILVTCRGALTDYNQPCTNSSVDITWDPITASSAASTKKASTSFLKK